MIFSFYWLPGSGCDSAGLPDDVDPDRS